MDLCKLKQRPNFCTTLLPTLITSTILQRLSPDHILHIACKPFKILQHSSNASKNKYNPLFGISPEVTTFMWNTIRATKERIDWIHVLEALFF